VWRTTGRESVWTGLLAAAPGVISRGFDEEVLVGGTGVCSPGVLGPGLIRGGKLGGGVRSRACAAGGSVPPFSPPSAMRGAWSESARAGPPPAGIVRIPESGTSRAGAAGGGGDGGPGAGIGGKRIEWTVAACAACFSVRTSSVQLGQRSSG